MDIYLIVSSSFEKGDSVMFSVCFPLQQTPSEKMSTLKGKNLLPFRAFFFPFRIDPFSRRKQSNSDSLFP